MLKDIKSSVRRIYDNFYRNCSQRFIRTASIKLLWERFKQEDDDTEFVETNVHLYDNETAVRDAFEQYLPISCVYSVDGFKVLLQTGEFITIEIIGRAIDHWGMSYFLLRSPKPVEMLDIDTFEASHLCVLLPLLPEVAISKGIDQEGVYAVITADWLDMVEVGVFDFPRFQGVVYQ